MTTTATLEKPPETMTARAQAILARLPSVRGRLTPDAPLGPSTWFQVGGVADVLFKPADEADLADFLRATPHDIPVTVIGVASNLIIRDGGIRGVVIRLGREFATIARDPNDPDLLHAGAAALDGTVAKIAQREGMAGLEFYSGIPGTIGGAFRTNAGCYGTETKDVLVRATAYDRNGTRHDVTPQQLGFTYRHCSAPEDWIFTHAIFRTTPDAPDAIAARMAEIAAKREASQPIREKTSGSTFANPDRDHPNTGSAWQAVDKAGCRGLMIGGAQMSEKHCNFMINTGTATAADLEALGEEVRRRVRETQGIELRWEIKRLGDA
jgi:UDP-N-acetylmuramate dehydrogenase